MSYCVNCGVRLHETAGRCALCGTEVFNPHQRVNTKSPTPFSQSEQIWPDINRRSLGWLITALFALPNIVCVLINLLYYSGQLWFVFVLGASLVLWVTTAFPCFLSKSSPVLTLLLTGLSASLYCYLISAALDGMKWFLLLALPISLLITLLSVASVLIWSRKHPGFLVMTAVVLSDISLTAIGVEICTDLYRNGVISVAWSLVAAAALLSLVILIVVVQRNERIREEIRRKLHI